MSVLDTLQSKECWEEFLRYKQQRNRQLPDKKALWEEKRIEEFIKTEQYLRYYELLQGGNFPTDFPTKKIINKEGTDKKRIVYSFSEEESLVLKFIAHSLYEFDDVFSDNCYAFRQGIGAGEAIGKFRKNPEYAKKYCFKADISNYFNTINIDLLLQKLGFLRERDLELFTLFERILREDRVYENGVLIREEHGAMAGTPMSPFFANVYLTETDRWFADRAIPYFRYSDDILIFADSRQEMEERIAVFCEKIKENKLSINMSKVTVAEPFEPWEFLGFSYDTGKIDLSANTLRKLKAKIKRKAEALRRWQRNKSREKKEITPDKAAVGFIRAMNRKLYGRDSNGSRENRGSAEGDMEAYREYGDMSEDFTWCRWFFPNITEDKSLREIDSYMQEYIRYIITGRHYKGNYRITYGQMKKWGYRSLVHEYYDRKKERERNGKGKYEKESGKKETGT